MGPQLHPQGTSIQKVPGFIPSRIPAADFSADLFLFITCIITSVLLSVCNMMQDDIPAIGWWSVGVAVGGVYIDTDAV